MIDLRLADEAVKAGSFQYLLSKSNIFEKFSQYALIHAKAKSLDKSDSLFGLVKSRLRSLAKKLQTDPHVQETRIKTEAIQLIRRKIGITSETKQVILFSVTSPESITNWEKTLGKS